MKKRIWGLILAVMLAASLCAVTAFADGDVAEVNGQGYPSFGAALAAAGNEGTVKLLQDATASTALHTTVTAGRDITIDLGGKTLTLTGRRSLTLNGNSYSLAFYNIGTLTVKNGTIALGGSSSADVAILNVGTLNIESDAVIVGTAGGYAVTNVGGTVNSAGTIRNDTTDGTAISTNGGTVNITGGTVEARDAISVFNLAYDNESAGAEVNISGGYIHAAYQCVGTNNQRSGGETPSNVTITGGELVSDKHTAIYWPSAGTLTVGVAGGDDDDIKITGKNGSGILACSGTLIINSGTISGTAEEIGTDELLGLMRANSGCANIGDAVSIVSRRSSGYTDAPLSVSVSGGSFSSTGNYALRCFDCNLAPGASELEQAAVLGVSGGVFDGTLGAIDLEYVPEGEEKVITGGTFLRSGAADTAAAGYIQDGAALKQDASGAIVADPDAKIAAVVGDGKYTSIAAALAAAEPGDTVEIQPGAYAEDISIGKAGVTLRGAGETNKDVVLTGAVTVDAAGVTLDNIWFQQIYASRYDVCKLSATANGKDLTISNSIIQRMTGMAIDYGFIVNYNAAEGTLTIENSELIGPVSGDTSAINSASPSLIGLADAYNENVKLVVKGSTLRTNGYGVFNRWNKAEYTDTVFTGLEGVEIDDESVTVLSCYMALNHSVAPDVSFDGCTFKNMRSWGMLVSGGNLSVTGCSFEGSNASRAITVDVYGDRTIESCVITGNTFDLAGSGCGVSFSSSCVTEESKITVDGNTFLNCNKDDGFCVRNMGTGSDPAEVEIKVTGSTFVNCEQTFTGKINLEDSETPNADKAALVHGSVETWYETLSEAVEAAVDGDTIRLLGDVDEAVNIGKNITILTDGNVLDTAKITCPAGYFISQISGGYRIMPLNVSDVPSTEPETPELPFVDVPAGSWYREYVEYVYVNGLMDGTGATTFEPDADMTRAMVWAILARMDGETVTGASWQAEAREWAMANGVSDGTDPNGLVTREQSRLCSGATRANLRAAAASAPSRTRRA